jgi:penicillin-binding protein 1A
VRNAFRFLRLILIVAVTGAILAGTGALLAPYGSQILTATSSVDQDIDLNRLDDYAVRSYIYAADGSLLSTLHGAENRQPVTLDKVPDTVKDSILAVEDADFYTHPGVNLKATMRALVENVSSGGINQGGSTITQQLVKNALLNDDQNLDRKSQEAVLAVRLEQKLTKDQILEKYLNTVYFGSGAYGVQAAAETYWGKNVGDLDWGEGAMLAALISNPSGYDPTLHRTEAIKQRQLALDRLVTTGHLSTADAERYGRTPVPQVRCSSGVSAQCAGTPPPPQDYFTDFVRQQLLTNPFYGIGATPEDREENVYNGGLTVHTTLNPAAQLEAFASRDAVMPKNIGNTTAAMVSVEPNSGAVRMMLGGPGFDHYQYNIDTNPPGRQPGSSMKVFVLLTLMEEGNLPFDSTFGGGAFNNPLGSPNPYVVNGPGGTLQYVTQVSSNGAFVRLGQIAYLPFVIDMARKLGVTETLTPNLSLPLGTDTITPLEMASAYSAIPNGGMYQPWYVIDSIQDRNGNTIYSHKPSATRAFSAQTACNVTSILTNNVFQGTGTNAKLSRQIAAGKTGTTEHGADTWFIGFTPYLTTAVWVGDPYGNTPVNTIAGIENFGGQFPAKLWGNYNERYHSGLLPLPFPTCDPPNRFPRAVMGPFDLAPPAPFPPAGFNLGPAPNNNAPKSGGFGGFGTPTTTVPFPNFGKGNGGGAPKATTPAPQSPPVTQAPPITEAPPASQPGGGNQQG